MKNTLFNPGNFNKYSNKFTLKHSKREILLEHIKKIDENHFVGEESEYSYFERHFLNEILGFDLDHDIKRHAGVDEGRGSIEFILKDGERKFMGVELKPQTKKLDYPQYRTNETPVEQAIRYARDNWDVDWILLSNFKEFRLYNWHTKRLHVSFEVHELTDKKIFNNFMLCFSKESHVNSKYIDELSDTIMVDKDIAEGFYKLYHETRSMLIKEIEQNGFEINDAIYYAQVILNRYMFICFAEDTGLLKSETSKKMLFNPIDQRALDEYELWHQLNMLFKFLRRGNDPKGIPKYNGGLFKEDLASLGIKIRDFQDAKFFEDLHQEWGFDDIKYEIDKKLGPYEDKINNIFKNLLYISSFNFASELDVNILGHIFENSIGDIEKLKEEEKITRKVEGIVYTPNYITEYICKNTIIPYLSKSGNANKIDDLILEYDNSIRELEEKINDIKILDPACGSGAFLNKAADILVEIHEAIKKKNHPDYNGTLDNILDERRTILLSNIFGVDKNHESVEITKLSLFLKVCRKGVALPDIEDNIKCGNSLIDDDIISQGNPFDWNSGFEKLNGNKFDLVIGNPPYVRQEKIKPIKPFLEENYEVYSGTADLCVYFFEKGLKLLKDGGILGYISSNQFIKTKYGKGLRDLILEKYSIQKYRDHTYDDIFTDVTAYPSIFILKNELPHAETEICVDDKFSLKQSRLTAGSWAFVSEEFFDLRDKIVSKGRQMREIEESGNLNFYRGILTGYNPAFIIDEEKRNQLIDEDSKNSEIIKPLLEGKNVKRWKIDYKNLYLVFTRRGIDINNYPTIKAYLNQFKKQLTPKNEGQSIGRKSGDYEWYEIQDTIAYYREFEKNKIIYPIISTDLQTTVDSKKFFTNDRCYILTSNVINLYYLAGLMSSKALNFVFKLLGSPLQGQNFDIKKDYVEQLPIVFGNESQQNIIIDLVQQNLRLNELKYELIRAFTNIIGNTHQNNSSKKFEYYLNPNVCRFYGINLTRTEKNIEDVAQGLPQKYNVHIDGDFLVIRVILKDGNIKDVIKVNFNNKKLLEFFYLASSIFVYGLIKKYRTKKNILKTTLIDIKIPNSNLTNTKDVENIEVIMEILKDEYELLMDEKRFKDLPLNELTIKGIDDLITENDADINDMVNVLFELNEGEKKIIKNL